MNRPTRNSAMRKNGFAASLTRYPHTTMLAFAQTLALALAAPSAAGAAAKALPAPEGEPIVIRADRAWEAAAEGAPSGAEGQVLHLQGNFEMRGADWRVTADSAQVRGPV